MLRKYEFLDKRVIKTKSLIRYSLLQLLRQKEFDDITVTNIVKEAGISRVSFYNHYKNRENLMEEIINDIIIDFISAYREPYQEYKNFKINDLSISSIKVFDHVYRNALFYTSIVNSKLIIIFSNQLTLSVKELWMKDYKVMSSKIDNELYTVHNIYALIGLIFEWVKDDYKYSPKYMSQQLMDIIMMSPSQGIKKISN